MRGRGSLGPGGPVGISGRPVQPPWAKVGEGVPPWLVADHFAIEVGVDFWGRGRPG